MFRSDTPYNDLPELPPPGFTESVPVLKACVAAHRSLGVLETELARLPNPSIMLSPMSLLEAQDSSEIENIVTTSDALFRVRDEDVHPVDPSAKEAHRYRQALYHALTGLDRRPLSTATAVDICRIIKATDSDVRTIPGTALVNDQTGQVIYTPPAGEDVIRSKLANWERFLHEPSELDPLVRLAIQHYQFEAIHPFSDGNGRTGRILNILFMMEQGLLKYPILYLSREILRRRADYYRGLNGVTSGGDWTTWVVYVVDAVRASADDTRLTVSRAGTLLGETKRHIKRERPAIYSHELIDTLFRLPYCRIDDLVESGIAQRQTASKYLRGLTEIGVLREAVFGRDKVFLHHRLWAILTQQATTTEPFPD